MKDVSNSTTKAARLTMYPRRRPSPTVRDGGVARLRRTPGAGPFTSALRRTPAAVERKRIREAQILSQLRDTRLLEDEYRYDVLRYMRDMEQCTTSSTSSMDQQPEIRWSMRPDLVSFLIEVHRDFNLRPETLYLTLNILDRYVSRRIVYMKHYQLVACSALWIAAKFEDAKERVPNILELASICGHRYEHEAFVQMERHVLDTIQWIVGHPTAEAWLRLACCDPVMEELKVQHVARFLMEITLFYREYTKYVPSSIALGSLLLARFTCGRQRKPCDETEEALSVVELLDDRLSAQSHELSQVLVQKYSYSYFSKASTHILQFYLEGRRFVRHPAPTIFPPVTPSYHNREEFTSSSCVSTPMSTSSAGSTDSDDMPITPMGPQYNNDPFTISPTNVGADDKENILPPSMQMHLTQHQHPSPVVKHLPDEGNAMVSGGMFTAPPNPAIFGRPKLNEINRVVAPSPRSTSMHP